MRPALALALAAILAAPALAAPALAQTTPPPEPPPPLYEPELLELAEVIGSIAFLRELCGGPDAEDWPRRMNELLAAEGATEARRARLAGAYNRGFGAFALSYRRCTPAAEEAVTRLSRQGETLTRRLKGRFGG